MMKLCLGEQLSKTPTQNNMEYNSRENAKNKIKNNLRNSLFETMAWSRKYNPSLFALVEFYMLKYSELRCTNVSNMTSISLASSWVHLSLHESIIPLIVVGYSLRMTFSSMKK